MKIHFIAIGGAIMHQLALDLQNQGHLITGSDDEIFDPSRSILAKNGLLPDTFGWFPHKIEKNLDLIVLGMHAKADNPELLKAQELAIPIQSFAEFVYNNSKEKKRVAIAGSHGKTTITSMVMHVLKAMEHDFDYLVGARLKGFDQMVSLTKTAPTVVLEGDEYLSSAIERRPKFHFYHPHLALISGIAWDHMNVFPTFDFYLEQFREFIRRMEPNATLVYFQGDEHLLAMRAALESEVKVNFVPYDTPDYEIRGGQFVILDGEARYPMKVIGEHNCQNLAGAREICSSLKVSKKDFYNAMMDFEGAARRMEKVEESDESAFYIDFAHAPSKVKATAKAMRQLHAERKLVAIFELHTYSSLNKEFLSQYKGSLEAADEAIVFYSPHTLEIKGLAPISEEEVKSAFGHRKISVYTETEMLRKHIEATQWGKTNLLVMTSGKLGGLNRGDISKFVFRNREI